MKSKSKESKGDTLKTLKALKGTGYFKDNNSYNQT
jgi:hypothetical protein